MIFCEGGQDFPSDIGRFMETYYPLFVYGLVLLGFVITNLVLAQVAGPRKKTAVKEMPYESGMDPIGDARQPFDVKFYLVAILFLVFDVELLFLYPWAVAAYRRGRAFRSSCAAPCSAVMLVVHGDAGDCLHLRLAKGVFRWR